MGYGNAFMFEMTGETVDIKVAEEKQISCQFRINSHQAGIDENCLHENGKEFIFCLLR